MRSSVLLAAKAFPSTRNHCFAHTATPISASFNSSIFNDHESLFADAGY